MKQWDQEERDNFDASMNEMLEDLVARVKSSGAWAEAGERERDFLLTPLLETTPQQHIDASWVTESMVCLAWAIGSAPDIPPYDTQCDSSHILTRSPEIKVSLLAKKEIERQRNIAELWHWRSRTRSLQQEGRLAGILPGNITIEAVIQLAASKAAAEGIIEAPLDQDFPACGKPYRDLTAEEFSVVTSIAQERHKAFNWLCGLSPDGRWDTTPTET